MAVAKRCYRDPGMHMGKFRIKVLYEIAVLYKIAEQAVVNESLFKISV